MYIIPRAYIPIHIIHAKVRIPIRVFYVIKQTTARNFHNFPAVTSHIHTLDHVQLTSTVWYYIIDWHHREFVEPRQVIIIIIATGVIWGVGIFRRASFPPPHHPILCRFSEALNSDGSTFRLHPRGHKGRGKATIGGVSFAPPPQPPPSHPREIITAPHTMGWKYF